MSTTNAEEALVERRVQAVSTSDDLPRRNCLDLMTPAEKAIVSAQYAVEAAGASPRLTDATMLLSQARDAVADHVDGISRPTTGWSFGAAVQALKSGQRVARAGWNGKGMWLRLVAVTEWKYGCSVPDALLPWICMKTADEKFVPWLASQTDVLAEDWSIVE